MRSIAVAVVWLAALASLSATTILPPTFEQLVARAGNVFEGVVVDTRSVMKTGPGGPMITTAVTFNVTKTLKGEVVPVTVLEFPGGTVGGETFAIDGMPKFTIGDRDLLFVNEDRRLLSPLVAFMYGRVQIVREAATGREVVRRFDGATFSSISRMTLGSAARATADQPMSLADFESQVTTEIARQKSAVGR